MKWYKLLAQGYDGVYYGRCVAVSEPEGQIEELKGSGDVYGVYDVNRGELMEYVVLRRYQNVKRFKRYYIKFHNISKKIKIEKILSINVKE